MVHFDDLAFRQPYLIDTVINQPGAVGFFPDLAVEFDRVYRFGFRHGFTLLSDIPESSNHPASPRLLA